MNYHNCLEELIKAISSPALVLDEKNKVILRNYPDVSAFDWGGESPIGKTLFDLFPNEQASLLHAVCQKAIDLKQPTAHPLRLVDQGHYHKTTAKFIPFFNPSSIDRCVIFIIEAQLAGSSEKAEAGTIVEPVKNDAASGPKLGTELEDAKAALRFLLKQGAEQISRLKEETVKNLGNQFLPYIEGLKRTQLNERQLNYTEMLEACASKLAEPFMRKINDPLFKLSPTEVKIASLIRAGKSNKEMAKMLNLSKSTILTHRHHVRAKLGLRNKKENLRSFLSALGSLTTTDAITSTDQ
jgi:DNA-binding CsgD family transcriptional regulator